MRRRRDYRWPSRRSEAEAFLLGIVIGAIVTAALVAFAQFGAQLANGG